MDAGDERAFEAFVEDRMMALFGTAYLLVGDVHHAEDLLQSALEKAYRRWRRIRTMQHPEAYVRKVIVNLANDRWRRRRRAPEVALEEAGEAGRPDDTALIDLRHELMVGLHQLPVGMRTVSSARREARGSPRMTWTTCCRRSAPPWRCWTAPATAASTPTSVRPSCTRSGARC